MKDPWRYLWAFLAVLLAVFWMGCNTSKSYKAKYEAAWNQIVQSEDWKVALVEESNSDLNSDYGDPAELWLTDNGANSERAENLFDSKYRSWITRAYYKIIVEAEAADTKIKAEYDRFNAENPEANSSSDENVIRILAIYRKKYHAHSTMLEGLKSWNAYEEYGSDDLEFFAEEHKDVVQNMYINGIQEYKIVDFLVYKLADLYHLDIKETGY